MRTPARTTSFIALVLGTVGAACHGPAAEAPDSGAALPSDSGVIGADASQEPHVDDGGTDSGAATDAGGMSDASADIDAGVEADAGGEPDAGVGTDAGADFDAGAADAGTGSAAGIPYDEDGPVPYTVQTEQVSNGGPTYTITLYMPSTAGSHPLVSFWCGTQQTAAGYVPYAKRLASYGIAMLIVDDPGVLTSTSSILPFAVYLVETWVPTNLGSSVDPSHIGLSGHSRGGALTLFVANQLTGSVAAWLGLDAVDNPLQNSPLAETILPNIGIPNGFLGAAVATDCAPATENYVTLYPLAPSPSVLVAFNGANHTQFEAPSGCTLCDLCMPAGTADENVVLAAAVRYFTAFFARELLGDTTVGPAFEGAGAAADVDAGVVAISSK
jgi:hypothetical protein